MKYLLILSLIVSAIGCGKPQKGDAGAAGRDGDIGYTGAPGPTGPAGTPGTVVTSVQLCPGTPSYPSTFIEVALCINNELYAVYSNPAFLTLIPPGTYSSTAIGSSCNLTVGADCVVTH